MDSGFWQNSKYSNFVINLGFGAQIASQKDRFFLPKIIMFIPRALIKEDIALKLLFIPIKSVTSHRAFLQRTMDVFK